ncbi:biotin and thiamine synthesis associated domain-containing protein [Hirsutella rhossiliensis]|uniref:biotin synthase n=1 Tax=Hirsutella rhossiliensis TaxID=111463 RepID=A0A9P8MNH4_9HYPO|nr:biotin and thiamine synthesis associated domain-containing protein [Hirsutella rhossiliensis]KAH0958254.1 biotin and thiamine synthesis associated domain-containing protein [Hirsutella rhossiliensis]
MRLPVLGLRALRRPASACSSPPPFSSRTCSAGQPRTGATLVDSPTATHDLAPPPEAKPSPHREAEADNIFRDAVAARAPRQDWTREEISAIYYQPLLELAHCASTVHRRFHKPGEVQLCTLMNIKVGGCTEDCSYCAQSTRYQKGTGLEAKRVESVESVLAAARRARDNGSTRFCMGAAWRDMRGRKNSLSNITEMVRGVRAMGMEVCVTLGMVDEDQARQLKEAGLSAYNHNLDTSREFYPSVITTRSYDDRLRTLGRVRDAGISVCSGGILGLGESSSDRIGLLHTVATLPAHPESFPVNALVPIKGTPLGDTPPLAFTSMLRTVATARILMPATIIRIAAGRKSMEEEKQALCFMAGANAIFTGDKMLTTDCNGWDEDSAMFGRWGLTPMKSFGKTPPGETDAAGQ